MATDKANLFTYLKEQQARLADIRLRSVSNLVESVMAEEVARAEQEGLLPIHPPEGSK